MVCVTYFVRNLLKIQTHNNVMFVCVCVRVCVHFHVWIASGDCT